MKFVKNDLSVYHYFDKNYLLYKCQVYRKVLLPLILFKIIQFEVKKTTIFNNDLRETSVSFTQLA